MYRYVPIFAPLALIGCASTQVNYNTLDISKSYNSILSRQVVYNILRAYERPFALPVLIKVSAASAGTTNSLTPTFTLPISPMVSGLTRTTAGQGLSLAASDLYTQTYTLSPATDPDQIRRLRTLNQYVTRNIDDARFEINYPLIETSGSGGTGPSQSTITISVGGKPVTVTTGGAGDKDKPKTVYVRRAAFLDNKNVERSTFIIANPDTTFVKPPGCLLCDYNRTLKPAERASITDRDVLAKISAPGVTIHKLEKNVALRNDWLYRPDEVPGPDAVPLLSSSTEILYAKPDGLPYFFEFVLFNEEASLQGTGSPSSGGQSDGRKTSPLERLSIPVANGTTGLAP